MKLIMSTASVILCTALLASFCNAFPYPDYWDRQVSLQWEGRLGIDVGAQIEQAGDSCPDILHNESDVFNFTNAVKPDVFELVAPDGRIRAASFYYECESPFMLFVSDGNGLSFNGSKIKYECLRDSGTYQPSIDRNGYPRCFRLCPEPSLPNGEVRFGHRGPNDTAAYSCRSNFRLIGPEKRTCREDGTWSGEQPVCEPIICPLVNNPIHGEADPSRSPIRGPGGRQGFPVGTVVTYTCDEGFKVRGESKRTCLENEEWDHPEPHCAPITIICPLVNPIPNGEATPSESPISGEGGRRGFPVGTVVTYTCDEGFELRGESKRTCLENEEWDHPEPRCVPTKCPKLKEFDLPKNVPEAKRQLRHHWDYENLVTTKYYNRKIEGDRSEGSKAYLECVNGWKLMKGTPDVQTCVRRENGELEWTNAGTCVYTYSYPRPWPSYG